MARSKVDIKRLRLGSQNSEAQGSQPINEEAYFMFSAPLGSSVLADIATEFYIASHSFSCFEQGLTEPQYPFAYLLALLESLQRGEGRVNDHSEAQAKLQKESPGASQNKLPEIHPHVSFFSGGMLRLRAVSLFERSERRGC